MHELEGHVGIGIDVGRLALVALLEGLDEGGVALAGHRPEVALRRPQADAGIAVRADQDLVDHRGRHHRLVLLEQLERLLLLDQRDTARRRVVHQQALGRLVQQLRDVAAEVRRGDRREQRLVDLAAAAFLHRRGEALGGVVADRDVGHHQIPALDATLFGQLAKAVDLHAVGDADAKVVGAAVLAGEVVRCRGRIDEQRVHRRHLRRDRKRRSGRVQPGEERHPLLLDEPAGRGDRRCRRPRVVLDDQLVLAPERPTLRVQALDGERRAVVDERAADGERAGVDVDDAELDGVLRQRPAVQGDGRRGRGQQFPDHCNPRWVRRPRQRGAARSRCLRCGRGR